MLGIASYNIENLDFNADDDNPLPEKRIPFLQASLNRLLTDILWRRVRLYDLYSII